MAVALLLATPTKATAQAATPSGDQVVPKPVQDTTTIAELVVTTQKRAQNEIDVPITLTAYSGAFLEKEGIQDLHDLSARVPGFFVQNQSVNDPGIVMRGVTTDSTNATDEPRVSIYQDGVSISRVASAFVQLFDQERVEVAKGPQTTLFGRAALTGAVNIISNKATENGFEYYGRVEGGNDGYYLFEGMANMPLSDQFALRISGQVKNRDGYIKNDAGGDPLNGLSSQAFRVSLNYHPNARINNDLILNFEYDDPSGVEFKNHTFYPSDAATGKVEGDLSAYTSAALSAPASFEGGRGLGIKRRVDSATDIATVKLTDSLTLTNTLAYRQFDTQEVYDPDGFSFPILTAAEEDSGKQYSDELRVNWNDGGKLSAFGGVSVFGDNARTRSSFAWDDRLSLALLTGVLNRTNPVAGPVSAYTNPQLMAAELQGLAASFGYPLSGANALGIANNLQPNHTEQATTGSQDLSYDGYFDATFKPITRLELTAGVRYTHDDTTSRYSSVVFDRSVLGGALGLAESYAGAAARSCGSFTGATKSGCLAQVQGGYAPLFGALATPGSSSLSFPAPLPYFGFFYQPTANNGSKDSDRLLSDALTYRFNARYALTPDNSLYATYARGQRPRVLSATSPGAPFGLSNFKPEAAETLDSYEVGSKNRFLDHRLSLEGAIYYYDYRHFSSTVVQNAQLVALDVGQASTYGFEAQAAWRVIERVDVFATYAYTHGRFDNGIYRDNQFRLTPENAFSIGASLKQPALGGVFELLPTYSWRSKVFFNDDNGNPAIQKEQLTTFPPLQFDQYQNSYGLLDLRLSYQPDRRPWKVEVFATNLTDTKYLKDNGNTGLSLGLPTLIAGEPRFYGLSFSVRG